MKIHLKDLQPNPLRDFGIDPVDDAQVVALTQSIKDHGFWGGVVCRKVDGEIQVAAGWHRVKAAIKAGITDADLFINPDMDDAELIRVYARENTTQRGIGSVTHLTGTVAAAIRYLAKAILSGVSGEITGHPLEIARGQILTDKGIGIDLVVRFLGDTPGITEYAVKQQLALLKASGDYGRIIDEVKTEIEVDNEEAMLAEAEAERERQAAEAAEAERQEAAAKVKAAKEEKARQQAEKEQQKAEAKAKAARDRQTKAEQRSEKHRDRQKAVKNARKAAAAAKTDPTFDLRGVQPHFENAHQLDVFRKLVTSPGMRERLDVNKQAALAKAIVDHAQAIKRHISKEFIHEIVTELLNDQRRDFRKKLREDEREYFIKADWETKSIKLQEILMREVSGVVNALDAMVTHIKNRPSRCEFQPVSEFNKAVQTIAVLNNKLTQWRKS